MNMSASSSAPFFEIREDQNQMKQQHSSTPTSSSAPPPVPPPQKKKRNQPGTPSKYHSILFQLLIYSLLRSTTAN